MDDGTPGLVKLKEIVPRVNVTEVVAELRDGKVTESEVLVSKVATFDVVDESELKVDDGRTGIVKLNKRVPRVIDTVVVTDARV